MRIKKSFGNATSKAPDLSGGGEEIRTLAPLTRPTAFRVRTLRPLGYSSILYLKHQPLKMGRTDGEN